MMTSVRTDICFNLTTASILGCVDYRYLTLKDFIPDSINIYDAVAIHSFL